MFRHTRAAVVLLVVLLVALTVGCQEGSESPRTSAGGDAAAPVPAGALNRAADARAVVDSARKLMVADSNVALVTVDSAGQPRVRTVRAFLDPPDTARPETGPTVWIMTRLSTRKVAQLRRHPNVTLYFNDDDRFSYATIMGVAVVHTDPEHPGAKRHWDVREPGDTASAYARFFWPDFPHDFVMIEVRPRWLEYMGPGVPNDRTTWRPQAVAFDP